MAAAKKKKAATKTPKVSGALAADLSKLVRSISSKVDNCPMGLGISMKPMRITPLGLPLTDLALGGGIPAGITHIHGPSSVGKTVLGLATVKRFQEEHPESIAFFVDTENALSSALPALIGVDMSRIIVVTPESAEGAMAAMEEAIIQLKKAGYKDIIQVWDSIAASATSYEMENDYDSQNPAQLARALSRGLKKLRPIIVESGTSLVCLNQHRAKIGVSFGAKVAPCGGNAPIFYSDLSIRLDILGKLRHKEGQDPFGIRIGAFVEKSRIGLPFRRSSFHFLFNSGMLTDLPDVYDTLKRYGLAESKGGVRIVNGYAPNGNRNWNTVAPSKAAFVQLLVDDPMFYAELRETLKVAMTAEKDVSSLALPDVLFED